MTGKLNDLLENNQAKWQEVRGQYLQLVR